MGAAEWLIVLNSLSLCGCMEADESGWLCLIHCHCVDVWRLMRGVDCAWFTVTVWMYGGWWVVDCAWFVVTVWMYGSRWEWLTVLDSLSLCGCMEADESGWLCLIRCHCVDVWKLMRGVDCAGFAVTVWSVDVWKLMRVVDCAWFTVTVWMYGSWEWLTVLDSLSLCGCMEAESGWLCLIHCFKTHSCSERFLSRHVREIQACLLMSAASATTGYHELWNKDPSHPNPLPCWNCLSCFSFGALSSGLVPYLSCLNCLGFCTCSSSLLSSVQPSYHSISSVSSSLSHVSFEKSPLLSFQHQHEAQGHQIPVVFLRSCCGRALCNQSVHFPVTHSTDNGHYPSSVSISLWIIALTMATIPAVCPFPCDS